MLGKVRLWLCVLVAAAAPASALIPQVAQADSAPPVDWVQSAAQGPSGRESAYLAYDGARDRTVLFGGAFQGTSPSTNQYFSDTWEYDGTSWAQIPTSAGAAPPAGALGQMVYDSARGVSVLFGGGDANGFLAPITWEWNGATWTPRFTTTRPPVRVWFGMAYDSKRHVTVLFGGSGQDAGGNHILLSDTWEYDGNDWRQVVTNHFPSGRYGHGLAYDSIRGKIVMFGGHDDTTGRLQDTWEYDGTDWTQVGLTNPPAARFWYSMSFVPALGKTVMFGGDYFVPGVTLGANNETWLYDGASWQLLTTSDKPAARIMAPAAYDSRRTSLMLFGGSSEFTPIQNFADTWALVVPESNATFSSSPLQFPTEPVLSTTSQSVTVTNTGNAPLAISAVAAGGDFATSDNCPRAPVTVAVNDSCTITVSFTPSQGNSPITGTLTVTDNAPGGSQSIPLSGSGQWGEVNPTTSSIDFGTSPINLAGPTAAAQLTIDFPDFPTIVFQLRADYPFTVTSFDCPLSSVIPVGSTCHAALAFQPTTAGTYAGQLRILANEPNAVAVSLSGTANPIPVAVSVQMGATAIFGQALGVQVSSSATAGTATFTFNGVQVGGLVALNSGGAAFQSIPLDDSTIPAGAGTYSLLVTVHPTDGVHSDSSVSQSVTVVPAPVQMSWSGSGLAAAGASVTLATTATGSIPNHPVWVRFEVTDSSGSTTAYYAQVATGGAASIAVSGLKPGAYMVRALLVAASGSSSPNAYVTSKEVRAAFAVTPAKGGYIAGVDQEPSQSVAFEFQPGSKPSGSLVWIESVQVSGPQGDQRDAFRVIVSTSVTSLDSHSHTITVTGTATVAVFDATTGLHYGGFDQTVTYQVTIATDGSAFLATNTGLTTGIPAGSVINHL